MFQTISVGDIPLPALFDIFLPPFFTIIAYSMETYNAISKTDNYDIWKEGIYQILESIGPIVPHIYEEIKQNIF